MASQLTYIINSAQLQEFCDAAKDFDAIAVDTEFMRTRTYWPQLCLVQIGLPDGRAAIVDCMAEDLEFDALKILLCDANIIKIFHAAKQDVEVLYHSHGIIPTPLFDSQLAALALGYGDQIGYNGLVQKILGLTLNKGEQFSNWQARPLSDAQITYAYQDVTHLIGLYPELNAQLHATGRDKWVAHEMQQLQDPQLIIPDPDNAWKRIKSKLLPSAHNQTMMQRLTSWRELTARKRDVPRGQILSDQTLIELVKTCPGSTDEIAKIRPFGKSKNIPMADEILAIIKTVKQTLEADLPKFETRKQSPSNIALYEALRIMLGDIANRHEIPPRLICGKDGLIDLVNDPLRDHLVMRGWRLDVFGKYAQALLNGQLGLGFGDQKLSICVLKDPKCNYFDSI